MRTLLRSSLPLLLVVATACAGSTARSGTEAKEARLVVDNRSSLNMDIYAIRQGDQVVRVGFAPAGDTTSFRLTPGLLAGATSVIFEARPVRRAGRRVRSEPFGVVHGDEITWSIPPQ